MSGNIRKVVKLQIAFVVHATNGLCPICKKVEEEILKSYHHIYKSIYNLNHQMQFKSCDWRNRLRCCVRLAELCKLDF